MSGFVLLVTGRILPMTPKGRNSSRDGLLKIGWMVYSLLFPCVFSLNKLLMPFFARMLRYQLGARFYKKKTESSTIFILFSQFPKRDFL